MADSAALAVVVLAAGKGTRMKSVLPKVLHAVGNQPMLAHTLAAAKALAPQRVVVVTAPGDEAAAKIATAHGATAAVQEKALGTGHAVRAAQGALSDFDGTLMVLFGDAPLITSATLSKLAQAAAGGRIATLGFRPSDPTGYGRMVVAEGSLQRIVEHKDASEQERAIDLCFAGPLAGPAKLIFELLGRVDVKNAQGEYYLTDVIGLARGKSVNCAVVEAPVQELLGVNSRADLAAAEAAFQARRRSELMAAGVTFTDPATVYLSADTAIEADVIVGPFVVFGPGVSIRSGTEIRAFCHIEGAEIGANAIVGPYARLRPGAALAKGVHIGNFVEVKNAKIAEGAKANHLTYIGDASVGAGSNIGAGTITCNYDGFNKTTTEIGANVFVGSNATLVAPLKVADGAYIAAGSVVTDDVEKDALVLGRARQVSKPGRAEAVRAARKAAKDKSVKGEG
jgi:bifunctional UDP-N-acetylglucosamine pyrophosphorylase/glucosamine-1-phosphate N-acetyltransferase